MASKLTYVTPENLSYFWQKVKEYYNSNSNPVAQANSLTFNEESITGEDILSLINQEIANLKDGIPESCDTLMKLATWVQTYFPTEEAFQAEVTRLSNRIDGLIIGGYDLGPVDSENTHKPVSGADVVAYVDGKVLVEENRAKSIEQDLDTRVTILESSGSVEIGPVSSTNTTMAVSGKGVVDYVTTVSSSLSDRITILENETIELGPVSSTNTTKAVSGKGVVDYVTTVSSSLSDRIEAISSTDIPGIKASITTVSTQISELQTTVGGLSVSTSKITGTVEIIQNDLRGIDGRISVLEEIDDTVTESSKHAVKSSGIFNYISREKEGVLTTVASLISTTTQPLYEHIDRKDNPHEVTKDQVGLGNVDNTSDIDKPISTAVQAALNVLEGKIPSDIGDLEQQVVQMETDLYDHTQDFKNPHRVTASQLNLGAFENLTPADLPVSDATQEVLAGITETVGDHITSKNNPHEVTAKQVGLDKVVNKKQSSSYIIEDGEYDSEKDEGRYFTMHGANQMYTEFNSKIGDLSILGPGVPGEEKNLSTEISKKLNADTVRDGLTFDDIDKPLSANQGMILNGRVSNMETSVLTLASPLIFRGVVTLVSNLDSLTPTNGDVYQVSSTEEFYAYNGSNWIKVSVVVDIINYMSDINDAYSIIDSYRKEEDSEEEEEING